MQSSVRRGTHSVRAAHKPSTSAGAQVVRKAHVFCAAAGHTSAALTDGMSAGEAAWATGGGAGAAETGRRESAPAPGARRDTRGRCGGGGGGGGRPRGGGGQARGGGKRAASHRDPRGGGEGGGSRRGSRRPRHSRSRRACPPKRCRPDTRKRNAKSYA